MAPRRPPEGVKKLTFRSLGPEGRGDLRNFRMRAFGFGAFTHDHKHT
jgi:hypothetical protein